MSGSTFMFTNFWNKYYSNTSVSVINYSDKNRAFFPVLGIVPLAQMQTFSPKKCHMSCEV